MARSDPHPSSNPHSSSNPDPSSDPDPSHGPEFHIVVFGATGFTGRLVAAHLVDTHGVEGKAGDGSGAETGSSLRWALAGRSRSRLEAVRSELGAPDTLPLVVADASDPASLSAMVRRTRVVITTVGPYARYGEPLVAACAEAGTDYVDLSGEPVWMARMIQRHAARARNSGARIVFSCGFDSLPFDLGVRLAQEEGQRRLGSPIRRVRGRVRRVRGTLSGGTIQSLALSVDEARADPEARRLMGNPYALTEGFRGPRQPRLRGPARDPVTGEWMTPFLMSGINVKNVHRTQFLLGHPSGEDFLYEETQCTGKGVRGRLRAGLIHFLVRTLVLGVALRPTRRLLERFFLPTPGEGPDAEAREAGYYDLLFQGETEDGRTIRVRVGASEDPGYLSTSRMLAESGVALALEVDRSRTPGGIWTAGSALGLGLLPRLREHARLQAEVLDVDAPAAGGAVGGTAGETAGGEGER